MHDSAIPTTEANACARRAALAILREREPATKAARARLLFESTRVEPSRIDPNVSSMNPAICPVGRNARNSWNRRR